MASEVRCLPNSSADCLPPCALIRCALPEASHVGDAALEHRGFTVRPDVVLYEKHGGTSGADRGILDQLGARLIPAGRWDEVGGMAREKGLIERQVIMPLARPELAGLSGLVPPRAIVLFGPPGTGKKTFAKGGRGPLGLALRGAVPVTSYDDDGRPGGRTARDVRAGRRARRVGVVHRRGRGDRGKRDADAVSPSQGLTNELLKLIPAFRERDNRLLVCATNSVRALDAALLRHGRFDYVIPVGPPDAEARRAIWERYLGSIPHDEVDMDALVEQSEIFTPADIEFAARRTAQAVFERAVLEHHEPTASTDDLLRAVAETRPTLTRQMVDDFEQDIVDYARL